MGEHKKTKLKQFVVFIPTEGQKNSSYQTKINQNRMFWRTNYTCSMLCILCFLLLPSSILIIALLIPLVPWSNESIQQSLWYFRPADHWTLMEGVGTWWFWSCWGPSPRSSGRGPVWAQVVRTRSSNSLPGSLFVDSGAPEKQPITSVYSSEHNNKEHSFN